MPKKYRMGTGEKVFLSLVGILLTSGIIGTVVAMVARKRSHPEAVTAQAPIPPPTTTGLRVPAAQVAAQSTGDANPSNIAIPEAQAEAQQQAEEQKLKAQAKLDEANKQQAQQATASQANVSMPATAAAIPTSAEGPELPPTVTRRATPNQPRLLNKNFLPPSLRGSDINVSVKVYVDASGRPVKVLIDKGVNGVAGYNDAAKQAAFESSYSPATKGGKPINGWLTLVFNFGKPR